jgi:hypothetical protein
MFPDPPISSLRALCNRLAIVPDIPKKGSIAWWHSSACRSGILAPGGTGARVVFRQISDSLENTNVIARLMVE